MELPRPVGFVLGGSLGAVQVGMLRALAEHGVAADLVVGTSVGSVNGALLAADPAGATARLAAIWSVMTRATVFPRWRSCGRCGGIAITCFPTTGSRSC